MKTEERQVQKINSYLSASKQFFEKVVSRVPQAEFTTKTTFTDSERAVLKELLFKLIFCIDEIEKILRESILSKEIPIQLASNNLSTFYNEKLLPSELDIRHLYSEVDPQEITINFRGTEEIIRLHPPPDRRKRFSPDEILIGENVTGLISHAVDMYEGEIREWDECPFDEDDLEKARKLVDAAFFQPNHWLSNAELLKPVLSENVSAIPWHVKLRLKEIYQSFLFGNWMAVFSLSRSVLEYALINKSASLGINAYKNNGNAWGVRELVNKASKVIEKPDISQAMDSIVERGNWVMHPKKKEKLIQSPLALRDKAYESVTSLRAVISELYVHHR